MLVDDDEFVRGALTRALNRTGAFSVIPAEQGQHALELLASERIDAMLTDLQMPVMDGLTLLGHLFERGLRVPVAVMITLGKQYHVICFLGAPQDSLLYLVLAREHANLGMARHQLAKIARRITL